MTVFHGKTTLKIDEKGRFNLPIDHRKKLGDSAIVTIGPLDQLEIWPMEGFSELLTRLDELSQTDESYGDTLRWVSSHSKEVGIDAQGRIALPLELRTLVGISTQIILLGSVRRIEVWPADADVRMTKPSRKW